MKTNSNILFICGLMCIALFIFIIYIQCNSWFDKIELNYTISPLDIFSLFVTILIGIFIAWYIGKQLAADRYGKEFILNDVKFIEDKLVEITKIILYGNTNTELIYAYINDIYNCFNRLNHSLTLMRIDCENTETLQTEIYKLYEISTDITNREIGLPDERKLEISILCSNIIIINREIAYSVNIN